MQIPAEGHKNRPKLADWLSSPEARIIRIFVGSCILSGAIIALTAVSTVMARAFTTPVLAICRVLLLWALLVSAFAFYRLLRFVKQIKEDLRQKSFVDELTGTFNFRYLDQRLMEEQERMRRYGGSTAVLFLDLDHFKEVNDEHGHQVGNAVLKGVAAVMKRQVRSSDILGRLGGDEFLVILPQGNQEQAVVLAERLRSTVEDYRLKVGEKALVDFVHVSIGLATYPQNGDSIEGVVMAADRAVYRVKEQGGNGVCVSEEFISTPRADDGGPARARASGVPAHETT